jgi:hypothetical protein
MGWLGKLLGLETEPHEVVSVTDANVVGDRAGHYHQAFLEQELLPKAAPKPAPR